MRSVLLILFGAAVKVALVAVLVTLVALADVVCLLAVGAGSTADVAAASFTDWLFTAFPLVHSQFARIYVLRRQAIW